VGIELGLDRVRSVANRLQLLVGGKLNCPVITVAGTNGKGSTCATLEGIYAAAGYRTGLYTSPHLVHFEERCRVRGQSVAASDLAGAFARVEAARLAAPAISLSYFEYTTLACLLLMKEACVDVAILEVGLGGRLDAVNIVDSDCAIVTSIDIDHVEFLGDNREDIGREKAGIFRAGCPAIIGDPLPPDSTLKIAQDLGCDIWRFGQDFNFSGDQQQWGWAGRNKRLAGLAYPALRGANQLLNAAGALAAVYALRPSLPVDAQAVRRGLASAELPGRFQIIAGQPPVILDVAHNPHSIAALAANLDAQGYYPCTHAVFGVMADKDLAPMLAKLSPIIDRWYFCDLPTARAASAPQVQSQWQAQNSRKDASSSCHSSPQAALDAAFATASAADRIVVFGSFYTVGGVLQNGEPRPPAPHLPTSPALPTAPNT
jgi:dihydrofolate synthase/folylpolyglutamate synthase